MRYIGANGVGKFSVEFEVANNDDLAEVRRGHLSSDKVRRMKIQGLVDSGAIRLLLPESVVEQLGIAIAGDLNVVYADGRKAMRKETTGVDVDLLGRHGTFMAIVEPQRKTALIGAVVLENLDFLVDCTNQRLVPRDPNGIVCEIE